MSRIFSASDMGEVQSISLGNLGQAASAGVFQARFADGQQMSRPMPGIGHGASAHAGKSDPLEQAKADAFAQGFDEGVRVATESFTADEESMQRLALALGQLTPAINGTLSTIMSSAVLRLVTQIVGEASVDAELLAKRVEAVAAFIEDGQNKQSLHVNPQDLPLLQDQEFGFALTPDDNVARGCVRLDTADGWIEDGPDIQLSRLKTMLDDMEGKG